MVIEQMRSASTVMLVRDGMKSLEVFMMVRNKNIGFASEALAFPGARWSLATMRSQEMNCSAQ